MNIHFRTIAFTAAAALSACGHPYHESTIFDGAVTVCTHDNLNQNSDGYIDWSSATSPRLEDFAALIAPRGGVIVESNSHPAGPIAAKMHIPFCDNKIPSNAAPYASVGSSKLDMTEAQMQAHLEWKALQKGTPYRAIDKLYVVDGVVRHINIMAKERYIPASDTQP